MKKIKIYPILLAAAFFGVACNPIEDESLRKKYFENAGDPITVEELNAALSVTQPIPNEDDKVEGDQYVELKNSRPDIGGAWHYETNIGWKITGSDNPTVIYGSNGEYEIFYEGISANQVVRSKSFYVTVTNCFDVYDFLLSGAVNKADKAAKKEWKLTGTYAVYNGMYGNWNYYDEKDLNPEVAKNNYSTPPTPEAVKAETLVFEFDGHKMKTYSATGALTSEGGWSFTHEDFDGIIGELYTTKPVLGQSISWYAFSGTSTPYWIIRLSEKELVLFFPEIYNRNIATSFEWDYHGTYFFFVPKK